MLQPGQQIVDIYPYTDEEGNVLYEVLRIEPGSDGKKKDFRQRRALPDGSLAWGLTKETRRVLWGLPELLESATDVALCCGEKDVKTARQLGFIATTNSGGEGVKWIEEDGNRPDWVYALAGKNVIFFPDNDEAGRKHAENVGEALDGIVASLAIVWVSRGKDLTEFMREQGGTNEELNALIEVAKLPENAPVKKLKELIRRRGNPAAKESEKLILGAIMNGGVPFSDVSEVVVDDFSVDSHKRIFQAIAGLDKAGSTTDIKAVTQRLEEKEQLDTVGGISYLLDLIEDLPSVYNVDSHIETVKRKAQSRVLLETVMRQAEGLIVGTDIDQVRQNLVAAAEQSVVYSTKEIPTATTVEIVDNIENFLAPIKKGLMCKPIKELMDACFGLHQGQLVVVGGRPSTGKSSVASLMAAYAAVEGHETEIISLEISKEEALKKICCMMGKVSYLDLISGTLTPRQADRMRKCVEIFLKLPLRIDDSNDWNIAKLRNHLKKRQASGKPVRLLMIDYLQLMGSGRQDGRRDLEIGLITRGLKLLAKEFGLTVILLSQLNRDMDKNNRRPQLSDLRDSGSIEADADIVIFTWQDVSEDSIDALERPSELILAKQRNGPTGTFIHRFAKKFAYFYCEAAHPPLNYSDLLA